MATTDLNVGMSRYITKVAKKVVVNMAMLTLGRHKINEFMNVEYISLKRGIRDTVFPLTPALPILLMTITPSNTL